jgi:hypothetical protein
MLPPVESRPCDSTGVFPLEEEGLGFASLEAEDLAIASDIELALYGAIELAKASRMNTKAEVVPTRFGRPGGETANVIKERECVPFRGRSCHH